MNVSLIIVVISDTNANLVNATNIYPIWEPTSGY